MITLNNEKLKNNNNMNIEWAIIMSVNYISY